MGSCIKILITTIIFLLVSYSAESSYPSFTVFNNDIQRALDKADAEQNLIFCARNPQQTTFFTVSCHQAVKQALEADIKYKTIVSKLILNFNKHTNQNMALLNDKIDAIIDEFDPNWPVDQLIEQIILSALSR